MKHLFLWAAFLVPVLLTSCEKENENDLTGGSQTEQGDNSNNEGNTGNNDKDDTGGNNGNGNNGANGGNGGGYAGDEIDIFAILNYDEVVYVEGGTFLMGAQNDNPNEFNYDYYADNKEKPVRAVTVSSFYIGKYEVTQGLWEYVMNYSGLAADGSKLTPVGPYYGSKPSSTYGIGTNYPVYHVSYNDIVNHFLLRLNAITGKNFRLPTEAEWEYAARGGQKDEYTRTHTSLTPTGKESGTYYKYAGSNTIGDVAWYSANSDDSAHPVGGKAPNALGLYDMAGNVGEWSSDRPSHDGIYRITCGGSYRYFYDMELCRISYHSYDSKDFRACSLGFRLALSL